MSRLTTIIVAMIGTALMMAFVIGLSHSISTGFAESVKSITEIPP